MLAVSDSSSSRFHCTSRPRSPPASLSLSTNISPAILWIAPVAAKAPVSARVPPTTIGSSDPSAVVLGAAVVSGDAVVPGAAVVVAPSPAVVVVPASPAHAPITRAKAVTQARVLARLLTFSSSSVDVSAGPGTPCGARVPPDGTPILNARAWPCPLEFHSDCTNRGGALSNTEQVTVQCPPPVTGPSGVGTWSSLHTSGSR